MFLFDDEIFDTTTNDKGEFERCNLPEGPYIVQLNPSRDEFRNNGAASATISQQVQVRDGQTSRITLAEPADAGRIEGVVRGGDGKECQIFVMRAGGPSFMEMASNPVPASEVLSGTVAQLSAAPDGSFAVENIPPGQYSVQALVLGEISDASVVQSALVGEQVVQVSTNETARVEIELRTAQLPNAFP